MASTLGPAELRAIPLFADVDGAMLESLAVAGRVKTYRKGAAVFACGDPPGDLYLVRRGRAHALVPPDDEVVNEIGPGEIFGELSFILGETRTATIRAATALTVWVLPRQHLAAMLAVHPDLAVVLSREVSRRLVQTTRKIASAGDTAVTAVWGDGAPVAAAIAAAGGGRTGWVRLPDAPEGRRPRKCVAVDAGPGLTVDDWFGRRVDGLDHLVVSLGPVPVAVNRTVVERAASVVLLDTPPAWFAKLTPTGRVVRCSTDPADLRRLGHILAGRAVGLVMSSGGSKTVAHIGALQALLDAGVGIDFVSGSSGGSLFAAGLAFGWAPDTMVEHTRKFAELTTLRRLDYARLPRSGLIRGARIHDQLRAWFDGARIEEADIPLRIVAADVETGAEVVLDSGDVADALRASMSIPGAFEPWSVAGRWLIDGAIVDPLPAAPLRAAGAGMIVASNVAGQENLRQVADGKSPGILQIVGRVVNASERELLRNLEGLCDVMIRPVVKAAGPLDFSHIDEFVAAGAAAAREALATSPDLTARRR